MLIVLISLGVWAGSSLISKTNQVFTGDGNIFSRLGRLIIAADKPLIGEENGQVNILLLGMGGEGHEGPFLTDTMIIAAVDVKNNEVVLTSIPRDFLVDLPKVGPNKINAAYAYASDEDKNAPGLAAITAAEQVTGLDIPYYAAIDFQGFINAVNNVGGLDITIDQTFTDPESPNEKYGFLSPVTFTAGMEHMDGRRALIFARSRHGNNNEGSDFARSERQKKIIVAFKEKVTKLNLTDLKTINNLLSDFTENFRTNLEPHELNRLVGLTQKISAANIFSFSLEPDGTTICNSSIIVGYEQPDPAKEPPIDDPKTEVDESIVEPIPIKLYIVEPCLNKTLADVQEYIKMASIIAKLKKENASLEVQNSTGRVSVTTQWNNLTDLGLNLKFTGFRGRVAYEQTIFYDNSQGGKPKTLEYLKNNFQFVSSDIGYPSSTADFVVVIGNDAL